MLPKLDTVTEDTTKTKKLIGKVGQNLSIPIKDPGNPWGFMPFLSKSPCYVSYVLPNSAAWKAGLRAGDIIQRQKFNEDKGAMIVVRNGREYACLMKLEPGQDSAGILQAAAQKQVETSLANHSFVLLVDSSSSMNTKDCPGSVSRWEWCRRQAEDLCSKINLMAANLNSRIDITTFNSNFAAHSHCKLNSLAEVFRDNIPDGETNMTPAIEDAVNTFSSTLYYGKPVVMAIITDGRPTDPEQVKKRIIRLANELRDPSLLTVVFIEIGTPEKYLRELDDDLTKQGAKADLVTLIPFSTVNSQGLPKTLADAVETRAARIRESLAKAPPVNKPVAAIKVEPDSDENDSRPSRKPPAPVKPSPQETEQARLAREQQAQEESKKLRAAANKTNFSQPGSRRQSVTQANTAASPQSAVEVNEKESVLRKESNREYK